MASPAHTALHSPIFDSGHHSLLGRALQGIAHPFSRIADALIPVRVCHRTGHVPGHDVLAYNTTNLDERYPGYVGHACGRCGQLVG